LGVDQQWFSMASKAWICGSLMLPMLVTMNFTDRSAWIVFGTSLLKTVVAVFVSYVSRLAVTPSLPTPVYPVPASAPATT
jgi:hypothetical protein